ncbi:MAG TPA: uroporphyrinogen decarboxylase family protein [Phycisphaerae bacterium]|nr:uroporphyrinogen decarboxylase family protein [Phycisphaerae bacterium]
MTSQERVFRTLEFRSPDRAPRDLWALPWVGQHARAAHDALLARYPSDFGGAAGLAPGERARGEAFRQGRYVDDWGCVFEAAEDGVVGEVKAPPLADWSALDSFRPPREMIDRADWDAVNRACAANAAGPRKFMRLGTSLRPFERMQFLRGSENLYLDIGYESAELMRLREMVHEFFLEELALSVKTDVDGISFMDDWGSQTALLISPAQWRRLFKPLYREYCDMAHAAGKKVFFHSDGHIFDVYEDLIELGVDAVNSQLFCMDIEEIARRFRGRITFWGEVCRQRILPFGTVADVRAAVGRVRRALDDGTGGVIAQCEWGVNNPPANIAAVFEAWEAPLEELP